MSPTTTPNGGKNGTRGKGEGLPLSLFFRWQSQGWMVRHASEVVARRLPPSGLFGFFGAVAGLTRPPAAALLNLRRPGRLTAGRACAPGLRGTPGLRLAPPPLY